MKSVNFSRYYSSPRLIELDNSNFIIQDRMREIESLVNRKEQFYYSKELCDELEKLNDMIELEITNSKHWEQTTTKIVVLLKNAPQKNVSQKLKLIKELEENSIQKFNSLDSIKENKTVNRKKIHKHVVINIWLFVVFCFVNLIWVCMIDPDQHTHGFIFGMFLVGAFFNYIPFLGIVFVYPFWDSIDNFREYIEESYSLVVGALLLQIIGFILSLNPIILILSILLLFYNKKFFSQIEKELINFPDESVKHLPKNIKLMIYDISDYELPKSYIDELSYVLQMVSVDIQNDNSEIEETLISHLKATEKRLSILCK